MQSVYSVRKLTSFPTLPLLIYPLLFIFVLVTECRVVFAAADSETRRNQIRKLETDLSREKEQFIKFDEKEKGLLSQLSSLEKEMTENRRLLGELRENIRRDRAQLKNHQEKLTQLDRSWKKVETRLAQRLLAFYKYAKRGYIQLFATSTDLNQLRKRIKYLKVVMREDRDLLQEMSVIRKEQEKMIALKEERVSLIDRMKKTETDRLALLKRDLDEKVLLLMKIHKEKEFYETAVNELALAAQSLRDTLLKLEREPDRQGKKRKLPSGFTEFKGKLPVPFAGKIVRNADPLGAGTGNQQKGIYILGPSGSEVKSIFGGRVDYSGWLKGYGQIIIINHGSRFFSVSAHLSERYREEGEMVQAGEVVGLLGDSESLAGPRLYFEIRRGGLHLDPFQWLKVH